jgi:glycerophosphoryl diester phosphodiesterase
VASLPSRLPVFVDTPVLCGHRGSGRGVVGGHPENTLASYRAAVDGGARWLEVDARTTVDDVLVARHDPVTDDGRFVAELTAAETDELGLVRVADVLGELPRDVCLDVDVKTSLEDALRPRERTTAALVADLLRRAAAGRRVLVTSFDPAALLILRERAPEVPVGLMTWIGFPLRKAIAAAAHLRMEVVVANVESFPLGGGGERALEREPAVSVRVAHQAGLEVGAWCPAPAEQAALAEAGVDCLVVDDVAAAIERTRGSRDALTGSRPASERGPAPSA